MISEWLRRKLFFDHEHNVCYRRGRRVNERIGARLDLREDEFYNLEVSRPEEVEHYTLMMKDQADRFKKYFQMDKFSRRLIIQFPMNWWEHSDVHYMPCIDSFVVQFISELEYVICINFRSAELARVLGDISMVKNLCCSELDLSGYCLKHIFVYFCNVHEYLDGSSDDYDVKSYFGVKS